MEPTNVNHCRTSQLSRRDFLKQPSALGISALAERPRPRSVARPLLRYRARSFGPTSRPGEEGLGIVIVGASSRLGAEMARQYANYRAHVVLAARQQDKLAAVAADVTARERGS